MAGEQLINERSGLILGLIGSVSHPVDTAVLVLRTTSVDSRSYSTDLADVWWLCCGFMCFKPIAFFPI